MSGKFRYNNLVFTFDYPFNVYNAPNTSEYIEQVALSGKAEVLELFNQNTINIERDHITATEAQKLRAWWETVRDGREFEFWADDNICLYLPFEKKVTDTTDGDSGTFARASVGTYIDMDTGLVTDAAANEARFEEGKYGRGLLIEQGTTNLIEDSEDFSGPAGWSVSGLTVAAENAGVAPDGSVTADRITTTGANQYIQYTTATAVNNTSGTFSIWARSELGSVSATISLRDDSPTQLAYENITVTTEWQRFDVSYTDTGVNPANWVCRLTVTLTGQNVLIWGAQLEIEPYATGYVATSGGTAARGAETLYYTLSDDIFNAQQFTISFWVKSHWTHDDPTNKYYVSMANAGGDNVYYVYWNSSGEMYQGYYKYGRAAGYGNSVTSGLTLSADSWYYVVLTVDTTIANGMKIYYNGTLRDTSTNSSFIPEPVTKLYIGSSVTGGSQADSIFSDFCIENRVVGVNEILQRYTWGYNRSVGRNYYSAVRIKNPTFEPIFEWGHFYKFATQLIEVL